MEAVLVKDSTDKDYVRVSLTYKEWRQIRKNILENDEGGVLRASEFTNDGNKIEIIVYTEEEIFATSVTYAFRRNDEDPTTGTLEFAAEGAKYEIENDYNWTDGPAQLEVRKLLISLLNIYAPEPLRPEDFPKREDEDTHGAYITISLLDNIKSKITNRESDTPTGVAKMLRSCGFDDNTRFPLIGYNKSKNHVNSIFGVPLDKPDHFLTYLSLEEFDSLPQEQ